MEKQPHPRLQPHFCMSPRPTDVVLGGQSPPPINSAVLGGINGVEYRLARGTTEQKIDALLDAFDYGQPGLKLIIQALENKSREIRDVAYWLLTESAAEIAKQALWNYMPYTQMQCLHTITDLKLNLHGGNPDLDELDYFAISPDGRNLLIGWAITYRSSAVQFWDLWTGQLSRSMKASHHGMGLSPDGKTIVSHYQHFISVINAQTEEYIRGFPSDLGNIRVFAVSPGSERFVVCEAGVVRDNESFTIKVWDYHAEQLVYTLQWKLLGDYGVILSVFVSPDGKTLFSHFVEATYSSQETQSYQFLKFWDMQTGEPLPMLEVPTSWSDGNIQRWKITSREHLFVINSVAVCPDGQTLISGMREGKVMVWNLFNSQIICSRSGFTPSDMTPDGKVFVYCSQANEIVVWDLESNQEICTLQGHISPIQNIALGSNREWIASYDAAQTIKIWRIL